MEFDAIILAGGKSRRMGRDKADLELAGETLLARSMDNARSWGARRIFVAGPARGWQKAEYVSDPQGYEPSSLLGFYAGMLASDSAWKVVVGCDMPFVGKEMIHALWEAKNQGGAVATWHNRLQPLPGLFPREASEVIARLLEQNRFHLAAVLDYLNPGVVARETIISFDPRGLSFFNINSPDEYELAQTLIQDRTAH